jgi:hypothetical protein
MLPDDGTTCPKHVGAKQVNKEDAICEIVGL